jgi:hypothetical protein
VQNQESGDLASILQLEPWLQEAYAHIVADPRRAVPARNQVDPPSREKHPQLKYSVPIASLPSAVILRDSFGVETVPLLSEAFRETHWYWTRSLLTKQVERSRPDIVIYLIVERALLRPPPDDPFAPKQPARKLRASKPRGQAKKAPLAAMTP